MANLQTDPPSKTLKQMLDEANEHALTVKPRILPIVDIDDPAALRSLAKTALVEIVQTAPRNVSLVAACKELLDRVDGKPAQTQVVEMKGSVEHKVMMPATQRFLDSIIAPVIEHDEH